MSNKDDDDWLDILAGKNVPDANPNTVREAQAFTNALRAEGRLQRIMAQLEADGYIRPDPPQLTFWESFKKAITGIGNRLEQLIFPPELSWKQQIYFAGVQVVLVIAVLGIVGKPLVWQKSPDEQAPQQPTSKSSEHSPTPKPNLPLPASGTAQVIQLDDSPQEVAKELPEAFTLAGAEVQVFQVDIKIPETPSAELRQLCGDYGINDIDLNKAMSSNRVLRFVVSPEPPNLP